MHLLVNHFISLDILRKYCKHQENHTVNICLLAVEQPDPLPAVTDWPSVLCGLCSMPGGCSLNADKIEAAIEILQNHIRDRPLTSKSPSTSSKNPSTSGKNSSTNKLHWILSKKNPKG